MPAAMTSAGVAVLDQSQTRVRPKLVASGPAFKVGVLVGLASGTVGVVAPGLSGVGLRPWHVLVCWGLAYAILSSPRGAVGRLRLRSVDYLTFTLSMVWLFSEIINSSELGYRADFGSVISPVLYLIAYAAVRVSVKSEADIAQVLTGLVVVCSPLAIVAILQVGSPRFTSLVTRFAPGGGIEARVADGRLIRATTLVGHWTGSGFFFVAVAAAACVLYLRGDDGSRQRVLASIGIAAGSLGAAASLTLTVLLTLVLVLGTLLYCMSVRPQLIVAGVVLVAATYIKFGSFLTERFEQQTAFRPAYVPQWVPNTLAYRFRIWDEQTIPVIVDRLVWGYGSNLYSSRERPRQLVWHSPESQWLGTAISYGVMAACVLFLLVLAMFVVSVKASRAGSAARSLYPVSALVLGAFAASFTVPVFTNRGFPVIVYVLVAICYSQVDVSRSHPRRKTAL